MSKRQDTVNTRYVTASPLRRTAGTGLVFAAAGIAMQIVGGADYPAVPPGLLILAAAAVIVLFAPWRWALVLATLATAFIGIGGVIAPNLRQQFGEPSQVVTFAGTVVQVLGLVVGLAFCLAAIHEAMRRNDR